MLKHQKQQRRRTTAVHDEQIVCVCVCRYQVPIYFILFGLFYSLHFISFYLVFLSQFTVVEDSSLSRALSLLHIVSTFTLASCFYFLLHPLPLLRFVPPPSTQSSFIFYSSFFVCICSPFRLDNFSSSHFFIISFFIILFLLYIYILTLSDVRADLQCLPFRLIHRMELNMTAICRHILIYLINKFVILQACFEGDFNTFLYDLSLATLTILSLCNANLFKFK